MEPVMTDSVAIASSFDSTRYTGDDPGYHHPNLVQAQAEAVTNLLLGRSLGLANTYAFDSRTALNLIAVILGTRANAYQRTKSPAGKQRIADADPLMLRWYISKTTTRPDFFGCCADQLRRLEGQSRFILSFWKPIDRKDQLRVQLADALTAAKPDFPAAIREIDEPKHDGIGEMERAFETLIHLDEYCHQRQGRGGRSPGSHIGLVDYVTDFEGMARKDLEKVMGGGIDIDTVIGLQESVARQKPEDKSARGWAHHLVDGAGGEEECQQKNPFLVQQRQLIDTLYNKGLADSLGENHSLLSSVPRTVGNRKLEQVNAFALDLIRYVQERRADQVQAEVPARFHGTPDMSELFLRASSVPDLQPAPLGNLLDAYWDLVADDGRWPAWRQSCNRLERSIHRAQELRAQRLADTQLSDAWLAHLSLLEEKMPHITVRDGKLLASIDQPGEDHCTMTGLSEFYADSLSAAEYVDHYLKRAVG
jgi:hypothetical protein